MSRFVKPETKVLAISNNETLVVKSRLNRGEQADMFARMRAPGDTGLKADAMLVGLERVLAFLVDWTITDEGKPVPYRDLDRAGRIATLNNMDPGDFKEIRNAIDEHEEAVEAAREAAKKAHAGASGSSATSTSVDGSGSPSAAPTTSTPTSTPSA
jgi:hypothetical protein